MIFKYPLTKPWLDNAEVEATRRVFESGWLAEGPETERFENNVCEFVGSKYAVAVSNATVGLELCLRAQDVKGKVVVPAFGHPATPKAIINAGCTPIFADVNLKTYNIQHQGYIPTLPVSWGGNPEYEASNVIAEDAACSLGSVNQDDYPLCFSFHPRKLMTTGEGGVVTTNNKKLAKTLRELKNFGYSNCKFDDVRAAIGNSQLKKLPRIIQDRQKKARVYDELLHDAQNIRSPYRHELAEHTYQTYACYVVKGNRDRTIKRLRAEGIEAQFGAYALHRLDNFRDFGRIGNLKNSELLTKRLIALPMAYTLTEENQQYIVDCLKRELA